MRNFKVNKNFMKVASIASLMYIVFCFSNYTSVVKISYICFAIGVYILVLPKRLINPKNIVFGYYLMWYGIAPLFANRYSELFTKGDVVNKAYWMFATTYFVAMLTLHFIESKGNNIIQNVNREKVVLKNQELLILLGCYVVSLLIYIQRTGGFGLWISDANKAFFSRGGSGIFYLIFEYASFIILFFGPRKKGIFYKIPYLFLCIVTMFFCGSKSIAVIFVLMLLNEVIMDIKLINIKSVVIVLGGVAIFVIGMYIRNGQYMQSIDSAFSTCLNYFDTFDEFLLMMKDFEPSFGMTILLPINWVLMKFGLSIGMPYYDTNIWLTNIYYPDSWANGGTHQWPLEGYLYINFYYVVGLIFVIIYFGLIGYIYKKAKEEAGVWRFIYLLECFSIISHLRGGLFNYWYIYLIPFYLFLLVWEKSKINKLKSVIN